MMTRSWFNALAECQTPLVTSVISGTRRSDCQRAAMVRANSGSSDTIRTLEALKVFTTPFRGLGLKGFRFFHAREQALGADSQIYGGLGVLGLLGLLDPALEVGNLGASQCERRRERALLSRAFPFFRGQREQRARDHSAPQVFRFLAALLDERGDFPRRQKDFRILQDHGGHRTAARRRHRDQ